VSEEATGSVLLDVGGVGYDVLCPVGTLGRARHDADLVTLHIHTNLRQDALELFGFASETDRLVFRQLVGVPNVGPRTALAMLSALPTEELCSAVQAGDRARLSKVPGIGKKTAERLVLELKDKLPAATTQVPAARASSDAKAGSRDRLLGALTNMGYRPQEAERAVKALEPRLDEAPIGELLREALKLLTP
jgi:Holliday junction DNA helicase RuvA